MLNFDTLKKRVFSIDNEDSFNSVALELFEIHKKYNSTYREFIHSLPAVFQKVKSYEQIPCLPIALFKSRKIILDDQESLIKFKSSGTTGSIQSIHYVSDLEWYLANSKRIFKTFYGDINDYCFLALLPSYLEREGSSLVYMANELISESKHPMSGFYLSDLEKLNEHLLALKSEKQKTILLGVSFALIDFAEKFKVDFPELIVMETGGMKGQRKELIREELHELLKQAFGVSAIHSEYGMTELFSQAYSTKGGEFRTPPWMKIIIRDSNDPFSQLKENEVGGMNIMDLANIYSCPFIATQDLGKISGKSVEILGRFDNSDIRGCNLLAI